jgi:hypothetical protein
MKNKRLPLVWPRSLRTRRFRRSYLPIAVFALSSWYSAVGTAVEIMSIEEHWELTVGEPDASDSAPQVSMVMSPNRHLDGDYFVFTLNHHTHPEWRAGGIQLQRWFGADIEGSRTGVNESPLTNDQEVISWTQRLTLVDGSLVCEVVDGSSESWGQFGATGRLRYSIESPLANLNSYQPAISLQQSGVSYAGNRVASLILRKLRWTDADAEVYELNAPIDVDADLDP